MPVPKKEEKRKSSEQQYQEFSESESLSEHTPTTTLSKDRVTSMAPNFRLIKFIHDQAKNDKNLYSRLESTAVKLGVKGVRPGLMRLIAQERRKDGNFNLSIQNLIRMDYDMAKELKSSGKTNEEISVILSENGNLTKLVKIVVDKIRQVVQ